MPISFNLSISSSNYSYLSQIISNSLNVSQISQCISYFFLSLSFYLSEFSFKFVCLTLLIFSYFSIYEYLSQFLSFSLIKSLFNSHSISTSLSFSLSNTFKEVDIFWLCAVVLTCLVSKVATVCYNQFIERPSTSSPQLIF